MGVKILNCSWGGTEYNPALKDAMQNAEILFVIAAGNNGRDISTYPVYPASFDLPNTISVAAIDNKGNLASFSNYGNKIDIAAPGVGILSTTPENNYSNLSGTSMAAPIVTGVAALILSNNENITPTEIKSTIKANSLKLSGIEDKVTSDGAINARASLGGEEVQETPVNQTSGENNQISNTTEEIPFKIDTNSSAKLILSDTILPCDKIEILISEKGKKEVAYQSVFTNISDNQINLNGLNSYQRYLHY